MIFSQKVVSIATIHEKFKCIVSHSFYHSRKEQYNRFNLMPHLVNSVHGFQSYDNLKNKKIMFFR